MFNLNEAIPEEDLKKCVTLALTYHLKKTGYSRQMGNG